MFGTNKKNNGGTGTDSRAAGSSSGGEETLRGRDRSGGEEEGTMEGPARTEVETPPD